MNTSVRDKTIVRLALITNFVATVVVAVATRSADAVAAVQAPLGPGAGCGDRCQ